MQGDSTEKALRQKCHFYLALCRITDYQQVCCRLWTLARRPLLPALIEGGVKCLSKYSEVCKEYVKLVNSGHSEGQVFVFIGMRGHRAYLLGGLW